MLEVKNLKKIYKTKNGAAVHALDGVSLRFPETGMVFLLGKSGSGKSTLLNVCGGLDSPTEGEVIVKGRSSKDFSQSDFDSYRNTFIGFIFQEYNILNEFSVEDNIALALELQGKPKDKAAIAALLEEVDLTGYAKRKPNTLSGGQKQRIAIARALVKKPEIIMADEPTGALDSNTGKQVFDTLKKLSKTKLVIVVSHDRDFAEQYGDRIIELMDGQVISDVSKTHAQAEEVSPNLQVLGDVLCIKKGADLTENDFDSIKKFLKKSKKDVVIATDEKSVKTFKTAARITDDGQMEVFRQTDPNKNPAKQYTKEESRFIRSKLPLRHAFKIGVSGLKNKPFRLFFTILLCSVAFILFGLLSTMNFYNSEATFRQTLRDADITAVYLNKDYAAKVTWYRNGEEMNTYDTYYECKFTPDELDKLAADLNANAFGIIGGYGDSFNMRPAEGEYWQSYTNGFAYLPENNTLRSQLQGTYPTKTGEMALSSYFADMLVACQGYDSTGTVMELNSTEELLGKKIMFANKECTITGIVNTGTIPEKFDALKEAGARDDYTLMNDFHSYLQGSLHQLVFVSVDQVAELSKNYTFYKEGRSQYMYIATGTARDGEYQMSEYSDARYDSVSALPSGQKIYAISKEGTDLAENEIIIPTDRFLSYLMDVFYKLAEDVPNKEDYEKIDRYYQLANKASELYSGGTHIPGEEKEDYVFVPFSDQEYESRMTQLLDVVHKESIDLTVGLQLFDNMNQGYIGDVQVYRIAGTYKASREYYESTFYVSDAVADKLWEQQKTALAEYSEVTTNYVDSPDGIFTAIYLPGNVPEEKIDAYWTVYNSKEFGADSSRIMMRGGLVSSLQMVDSFIEELSKIFLYVGLVLAVFAALLLSNFISVSISNKKREIGILRAVGARSFDVFKIFFSESFVIGLICVAVSGAASYWLCNILNKEYASDLGASVFVFGIPSIAILIGIAAATILVATFLPVYNAAKKKPVDSIRAV